MTSSFYLKILKDFIKSLQRQFDRKSLEIFWTFLRGTLLSAQCFSKSPTLKLHIGRLCDLEPNILWFALTFSFGTLLFHFSFEFKFKLSRQLPHRLWTRGRNNEIREIRSQALALLPLSALQFTSENMRWISLCAWQSAIIFLVGKSSSRIRKHRFSGEGLWQKSVRLTLCQLLLWQLPLAITKWKEEVKLQYRTLCFPSFLTALCCISSFSHNLFGCMHSPRLPNG